jgi:predicted outer membrane repeat protein
MRHPEGSCFLCTDIWGCITLQSKTAPPGGLGGALFIASGSANVTGCAFTNNTAPGDGDGGAIAISGDDMATIADSAFTNSAAGLGGAIYNVGVALITNCTFTASLDSAANGFNAVTNDGCSASANATFACPQGTTGSSVSMAGTCGGDQCDCTWPVLQLPPTKQVVHCKPVQNAGAGASKPLAADRTP